MPSLFYLQPKLFPICLVVVHLFLGALGLVFTPLWTEILAQNRNRMLGEST